MSNRSDNGINIYAYLAGFITSVFLTIEAYLMVVNHTLSGYTLVFVLIGLAIVQFWVQMFFFLHLGSETKPRWRQMTFWMMIVVVLILVVGSLWIMHNLNYGHSGPGTRQINKYLDSQDGL